MVIELYQPPHRRRREDGWRQEAFPSQEYYKLKTSRTHRIWSAPSIPTRSALGRHDPRRPRRQTASTVIQGQVESERNRRFIDTTIRATKSENDTAFETYKMPSKHPPNTELSPRVSSPIESAASTPKPSIVLKSKPTTSTPKLKSAHISFELDETATSMTEPVRTVQAADPKLRHPEPNLGQPLQAQVEMESDNRRVQEDQQSIFDSEWQYIQQSRRDCWSVRAKTHEMRAILRQKQIAKSTADNNLFHHIRMQEIGLLSGGGGQAKGGKSVMDLVQDCELARSEYGPLEYDCNLLEDQLSRQEYDLQKIEAHFFQRWKFIPSLSPEASSVPKPQQRTPGSSLLSEEEEIPEYHPLVIKLLSKTGDLELLKERLDDIDDERRLLEEKSEAWECVGRSLGVEEQTWLNDSQKDRRELLESICTTEGEIEVLKQDCLAMKLVDEEGEPTNLQFQGEETSTFVGDEDVDPQGQTSEYVKFPLLLPNPGKKQEEVYRYDLKPDEKTDFTTGRINQWLLERLRSSPLDVNLLVRTYEGKGGKISDRFEIAVLSFWFQDGTFRAASKIRAYTPSMTTQAPLPSDYSDSTEVANIVAK